MPNPEYTQLILDLDGTVYLDGLPIGRVIEQINTLAARGVNVTVLTNNTSVSKSDYVSKLQRLGLNVRLEQIITPAEVAGSYLREHHGPNPRGFVLGTPALRRQLSDNHGIVHTDAAAQFVLLSFDRTLNYPKLQRAAELINAGVPYYLTNIDVNCPTRDGPIPDCGSFARMLEDVTGVQPLTHFGKPGEVMAAYLKQNVAEKALLAGDRLYTDIELGVRMGVDTLLVFSGETKAEDLPDSSIQPRHTALTLEAFLADYFDLR
ncbi:HAD-IIA family hydrolase [Deinococcus sp. QL22]|uniref:HAD-IIA family hydrolase n=1 Tax=Deinococcus sp. QL22 TaxID=2939437 RepID=UPI0020177404|nr:HAD-IIA family hydrolase [Deinococcus sp. QL22]UQN08240.1 HAD-IIA family hydrolase [Deinococcus sp. QL22]